MFCHTCFTALVLWFISMVIFLALPSIYEKYYSNKNTHSLFITIGSDIGAVVLGSIMTGVLTMIGEYIIAGTCLIVTLFFILYSIPRRIKQELDIFLYHYLDDLHKE